jgi:hypothetical protein
LAPVRGFIGYRHRIADAGSVPPVPDFLSPLLPLIAITTIMVGISMEKMMASARKSALKHPAVPGPAKAY